MNRFILSLLTAGLIALAVEMFSIYVLAVNVPRVVGPPAAQEYRSLSFPAVQRVRIINENGAVHVRAVNVPQITIEADIKAYDLGGADLMGIQVYLRSLIQAAPEADGITVTTEPGERPHDVEIRVEYAVIVPEGTNVDVRDCNGNIWISKGCGGVTISGRNSDVEIVEPRGPVAVESVNGRIRLTDAPKGATIRTMNGNIYAHMTGGALDAATTNGAIVARLLDKSVNGCKLSSENGGITLVVPEDFSATVDAFARVGRIKNDFEQLSLPELIHNRRLHCVMGTGDTLVNIETLNGNIWVARGER